VVQVSTKVQNIPHITQISGTFLQQAEVEILSWSDRSANLNPIEHVWDIKARRLRRFPQQANSLEELRRHLQQTWDEIPQEGIHNLIWSMPQRVREYIANHGDATNY
jgi:hypothetical protein